jgi:hypothetical protein
MYWSPYALRIVSWAMDTATLVVYLALTRGRIDNAADRYGAAKWLRWIEWICCIQSASASLRRFAGVVNGTDLNSNDSTLSVGLCPRRFKSCRRRYVFCFSFAEVCLGDASEVRSLERWFALCCIQNDIWVELMIWKNRRSSRRAHERFESFPRLVVRFCGKRE